MSSKSVAWTDEVRRVFMKTPSRRLGLGIGNNSQFPVYVGGVHLRRRGYSSPDGHPQSTWVDWVNKQYSSQAPQHLRTMPVSVAWCNYYAKAYRARRCCLKYPRSKIINPIKAVGQFVPGIVDYRHPERLRTRNSPGVVLILSFRT